jgi:thiamine kinase-like enzyme
MKEKDSNQSLCSFILESFKQYNPELNAIPDRIKNTCFPLQENTQTQSLEIVGTTNGLIVDKQAFVKEYTRQAVLLASKGMKFIETNFMRTLLKKPGTKVTINSEFNIVLLSEKSGICIANIKNEKYIVKINNLHNDTNKLLDCSKHPLYLSPSWVEAIALHLVNKNVYGSFNIHDVSMLSEYYHCIVMKRYTHALFDLDIGALKEKRHIYMESLIAQVVFCLLLPQKQAYRLCHNDLHVCNICVEQGKYKHKYVRLECDSMWNITGDKQKHITLKIPTHGDECFLIDYENASLDLPCENGDFVTLESCKDLGGDLEHDKRNTYTDLVQFVYSILYLELSGDYKINKTILQDLIFKKQRLALEKAPLKYSKWSDNNRFKTLYEHASKYLTWKSTSFIPFICYMVTLFGIPEEEVPENEQVTLVDLNFFI